MSKMTIKDLVSLILEQINAKSAIDQLFPPDKDVYIDNPLKYPELFETPSMETEPTVNEPALEPEPELQMAAEDLNEAREFEYEKEQLPEPLRILAETLVPGTRGDQTIPNIICMDPETNDLVEGVVISDLVLITPSGKRVLVFYNYGSVQKVDKPSKKAHYIVLADNRFMKNKPRGKEWGKEIPRDVSQRLAVEPEGETEDEKQQRLRRLKAIREGNAKRYGIFPIINAMFSDPEILDHLDICLVPETWATPPRTEHTTNRILLRKFGGTTPEIDADFISVRDLTNVDEAINDVMDLRAELAMGDTLSKREREMSKSAPRRHANYIYAGGNWNANQRVHDENFFRREGGKTPIYQLLSKNIQEGNKNITIESKLVLKGNVVGDFYEMHAGFTATLSARHPETGAGQEVGDIFKPIKVSEGKPLPEDVDPENFTLEQYTTFFVDQGRTTSDVKRTGFLPTLMERLGREIKEQIDPDEVLATMIQLVQNAVDQEPEEII